MLLYLVAILSSFILLEYARHSFKFLHVLCIISAKNLSCLFQICFYMMTPKAGEAKFANDSSGGEIEIENVPIHEVEIRRKDLLPVFEHFQTTQSGWLDR